MPTPTLTLFAEVAAPAGGADPAAPAAPSMTSFLLPIGLLALFYVVVMLPASRRQKREAAAMFAGVKAGSRVLLGGGIVGTIVRVKDGEDEVVVKSEDSKFRVLRSSIVRVLGDETPPAEVK